MVTEVADVIGQKYRRLSMRAKIKYHAEQVKIEIGHLNMLTSHSRYYINEMELELKYIQDLEEAWAKEANILKTVRKQQQLICHDLCDCLDALDKPVVVDKSNSNDDNAIAKWVAANPEYPPPVALIGNKRSSSPAVAANQVQFTTTIKHTTSGIGGAITGTGIGSLEGNNMGFDKKNGISSAGEVGVGSISMGSGSNNSVGSSDVEVDAGGNPEDAIVCLGALWATATGPAFFWFNIAVPISPTANHGHPTPVSSVVQVGQAIKPLVLFF